MSNLRHRIADPIIRTDYSRPGTRPTMPASKSASIGGNIGFYDDYGYAGNVVGQIAYQPNGFYEVQANWTVPSVSPTNQDSASTIWPGIGAYASQNGLPNNTLVQAGTEQDYTPGSGAAYYAWYEACCKTDPTENVISNFHIHPGDKMFVSVDLLGTNADAAYSKEVIYDVEDVTTGVYPPPIIEPFSPASGGDAEFILESPGFLQPNGTYSRGMLADFGTMSFSNSNYGIQYPNNSLASEYQGGCVGSVFHYDPHMATFVPVPPGIPLANPKAFTDFDGCDFPIVRVNPGD